MTAALFLVIAPGVGANDDEKYQALAELLSDGATWEKALPADAREKREEVLQGNCLRDPTIGSATRDGSVAVKHSNQARNEPCSGWKGSERDQK